jgi:signal transduction histidine kinase
MDQGSRQVLTVARSLLEQLDVEAVLERVLDAARELTGARYAAVGVLAESRDRLSGFLTSGIDEPTRNRIGALPTGRGVLGELIRRPEPLRIDDVGSHPHSYGFPVGHPPMRTFLGVPILVGGVLYGNLYLTEKAGGGPFEADDEQAATLLAELAAVAIDHARRFSGSETHRIDLQRTVAALDATVQIARALAGQTDLAAILELVAKRGRALVSARALVIELRRGDDLELAAGAGELPVDLLGQRVPLADTVANVALLSGVSQRLTDDANRERFQRHGLGLLGLAARDALIVPLVFREQSYGVLVAVDSLEASQFSSEQQRLLEAFAVSAASAVATAQSAADERRRQLLATTEAERARWARELHDETLQALGSLRLMLSTAGRSGSADAMQAAIARSLTQLESDIATLRSLITELRPAALDQLGLEPALLALVDRLRSNGLELDVDVELAFAHGRADQRLTPELETAVYRIVQEALTNAVKHGGASRAVLEVRDDQEFVQLSVRDDGSGFDPAGATGGFGMLGMRERAALLDGSLEVDSAPGAGTTVRSRFPVKRRRAEPPGVGSTARSEPEPDRKASLQR